MLFIRYIYIFFFCITMIYINRFIKFHEKLGTFVKRWRVSETMIKSRYSTGLLKNCPKEQSTDDTKVSRNERICDGTSDDSNRERNESDDARDQQGLRARSYAPARVAGRRPITRAIRRKCSGRTASAVPRGTAERLGRSAARIVARACSERVPCPFRAC
jgi:hypothetical protein